MTIGKICEVMWSASKAKCLSFKPCSGHQWDRCNIRRENAHSLQPKNCKELAAARFGKTSSHYAHTTSLSLSSPRPHFLGKSFEPSMQWFVSTSSGCKSHEIYWGHAVLAPFSTGLPWPYLYNYNIRTKTVDKWCYLGPDLQFVNQGWDHGVIEWLPALLSNWLRLRILRS